MNTKNLDLTLEEKNEFTKKKEKLIQITGLFQVLIGIAILSCLIIIYNNENNILLLILNIILLITLSYIFLFFDKLMKKHLIGIYECPHCKNKFLSTYQNFFYTLKFKANRHEHIKCPECKKEGARKINIESLNRTTIYEKTSFYSTSICFNINDINKILKQSNEKNDLFNIIIKFFNSYINSEDSNLNNSIMLCTLYEFYNKNNKNEIIIKALEESIRQLIETENSHYDIAKLSSVTGLIYDQLSMEKDNLSPFNINPLCYINLKDKLLAEKENLKNIHPNGIYGYTAQEEIQRFQDMYKEKYNENFIEIPHNL